MEASVLLRPPQEGEGRLTLSEAKWETGWGDGLSIRAPLEWKDCHPTPIAYAIDPPPLGEGTRINLHSTGSTAA